jgi:hypothetical protein
MPRLNVTNVTSSGTLQSVDTFSSTDGFRLPSYSTAQRPTGIPDGTMIWNTTASAIEIYGSSQWNELGSGGGSAAIDTWADAAARPTTSLSVGQFGFNQDTKQFEVYNVNDAGTAEWLLLGNVVAAAQWHIIMMTPGAKGSSSNTPIGSPGSSTWRSITSSNTGASGRTAFGDGEGLYEGYFTITGATKVALVSGNGDLTDPSTHSKYLVYDLVETAGDTTHNILIAIDDFCNASGSGITGSDASGYTTPSVNSLTGNTNGYSGTLSASGGTWQSNNGTQPDKFVYWGINTESDDDTQALCAFSGNLSSGKMDSWRNNNPNETFWSYWGHDFHSDASSQRLGNSRQTEPGIATGSSQSSETVYMLVYVPG